MTALIHLVRHAAHGLLDRTLCGRMAGVRLGAEGQAQAHGLARRFAGEPIAALYTSPLERAIETADPIGERTGRSPEVAEALTEIDLGEWTGRSFDELREDSRWAAWNAARSVNRAPGGESMLEVQARAMGHVERVRAAHPDATAILVSHSDVIKAVLLFALGLPLDAYGRIEVGPASISTLVVGDWGAKVLRINEPVAA